MAHNYNNYIEHQRKSTDIKSAIALMMWDQEVMMPPKGAVSRGNQIATLSGISHEHDTSEPYNELLQSLLNNEELSKEQNTNIQLSWKDYHQKVKLPKSFIEKSSLAFSKSFNSWHIAKNNSDFAQFLPNLEEVVALKIEESELLGYENNPYDALLETYEPDAKVKDIDFLFEGVKLELKNLLDKVMASPQFEDKFANQTYDKDQQLPLGLIFLKQMGYDFEAGRQDLAPHPFNISFSNNDSRVTTRINEADLFDMITSCIHEGGHALYEQGLLSENYGLPAGEAISLGIHESQSRFWENCIGRSEAFWKYNYKYLLQAFPSQCKNTSANDTFKSINKINPSLIRVQADELTYHFHIIIRYELEKALINKQIKPKDLPHHWNEMYKKYLGIQPKNDAEGVLQDIHWAHGSIGYFATYSLGSFYAAQFYDTLKKQSPSLDTQIENGDLLQIKQWLNTHIHQYGRLKSADQLCIDITGEKLHFKYFMNYLTEKISKIYTI